MYILTERPENIDNHTMTQQYYGIKILWHTFMNSDIPEVNQQTVIMNCQYESLKYHLVYHVAL